MQDAIILNTIVGISVALLVGLMASLFWSLHVATKPVEVTNHAWTILRPTIFTHWLTAIFVLVFPIFLVAPLLSILGFIDLELRRVVEVGLIVLGVIMAHHLFFDHLAKVHFNIEGIKYQALWRHIEGPWSIVSEIKMGTNGPKVFTADSSFTIANTRRGFSTFLQTARSNGVKIQNSPYLNDQSSRK